MIACSTETKYVLKQIASQFILPSKHLFLFSSVYHPLHSILYKHVKLANTKMNIEFASKGYAGARSRIDCNLFPDYYLRIDATRKTHQKQSKSQGELTPKRPDSQIELRAETLENPYSFDVNQR